jgi:hypothetical protein
MEIPVLFFIFRGSVRHRSYFFKRKISDTIKESNEGKNSYHKGNKNFSREDLWLLQAP